MLHFCSDYKLKKGEVVILCNGFLLSSIASYNTSIIEEFINDNDINSIGDILCTNNMQIKIYIIKQIQLEICGSVRIEI